MVKETELYTFCTETTESLVHIFRECKHNQNVWLTIFNILKSCGVTLPFHSKDINRGLAEHVVQLSIYICICRKSLHNTTKCTTKEVTNSYRISVSPRDFFNVNLRSVTSV